MVAAVGVWWTGCSTASRRKKTPCAAIACSTRGVTRITRFRNPNVDEYRKRSELEDREDVLCNRCRTDAQIIDAREEHDRGDSKRSGKPMGQACERERVVCKRH